MRHLSFLLLPFVAFLMACEQPYLGESMEPNANVVLHVAGFEKIPFDMGYSSANAPARQETRTSVPITDICTRLNFVVYDGENKLKSVAQKQGDANFGTVAFNLPEGIYTFAVIGHNSDGTCTVTSLDKISFKDNRVTDTFSYSDELEVGEQPVQVEVELRRNVAMIRFLFTDKVPAQVKQMKFYYTGGSSTLSALTGYGSVNSRQTVKMAVEAGQQQFEVYTIPKDETGTLKMTITALDANENPICERVFNDVPVQRNMITSYTGVFFGDVNSATGDVSISMTASPEWDGENKHSF